nr:LPS-assembly protein LptD [Bacteroidota bacterium]
MVKKTFVNINILIFGANMVGMATRNLKPSLNYFYGILIICLSLSGNVVFAQHPDTLSVDTTRYPHPFMEVDSLISKDTIPGIKNLSDTLDKPSGSLGLDDNVKYNSKDSIRFDIKNQKVYLYGDASIEYGSIKLKAQYIEIDFATSQVYAKGLPDTTGKVIGNPLFSDAGQDFESEQITYNFESKQGLIKSVITKDGEGYLHGEKIKKMPDDRINIKNGKYTTCDLKHPHFEFRYNKAQVIPDNKIVSGPAWMVIEGVPVPLLIPFGLFPNKTGQRSGIIIPSFGESANRGFFLEGGGYYFGINDYMDLTVTGDIYSSGSWSLRPTFRYSKRYRFNGNFDFSYAKNISGDRDSPDRTVNTDFSIRWSHAQDAKARPNSRFSASVNIVSANFNQFNLTSTQAYLSNTFQSSIAYQTDWNKNLFLTLNASHQQNTIDRSVNITLPSMTFSTKQFFPLRRKKQVGKLRWYENINLKYSASAENRISTKDSLLFKPGWEEGFRYGAKHAIPISTSFKVLKHFTLTNSINYNEKWYPYSIRKSWINDSLITETDTVVGYVKTDTVQGFVAARDFSFSATLRTMLYGMYQFKKGPVVAIRHVITPSVSFSYNPDFGSDFWGYYHDYQYDGEGNTGRYSIFEGSLYGGPPDGKSGSIGFSLSNNLEMKVRSKKDTITGMKKVKLIDNFRIATSYDIAKDSLNWAPLTLSGNTILFKKINISYGSSWDPYVVDSSGTRNLNQFEWNVNKRLF